VSDTKAPPVKVLYTAEATATGGRTGHARTSDGRLEVDFSSPAEMGGDGGPATNPEQLFAAGYAACFQSAMGVVARREKLSIDGSTVTARVGIGPTGRAFGLTVELRAHLPSIPDRAAAVDLVEKAHQVCPYSNATRDNIDVRLTITS
jgi:osmotically inducible protein OsmC